MDSRVELEDFINSFENSRDCGAAAEEFSKLSIEALTNVLTTISAVYKVPGAVMSDLARSYS